MANGPELPGSTDHSKPLMQPGMPDDQYKSYYDFVQGYARLWPVSE